MSTSPATAPPYQIATSNNHTKIHKSPVTFHGQDFLTTATQWTKKRIFSREGSGNAYDQVATSPPTTGRVVGGNGSLPSLDAPSISFGHNGEAIVAYTGCVQLWLFGSNSSGDAYVFAGSTYGTEGKIVSATLIPNTTQVVVQTIKRQNTILEVHSLNKQTSSLLHSLVLPPTSSGPGPYHVYCPLDSDCFAVVSEITGLLTLFSTIDFHPLPLSGLETSMGADNAPLFDIKGRWLVFAPKNGGKNSGGSTVKQTALKLPPEGPLYERIVGNLSSTAAASLKSLSDAGVNGIRAYLNKDGAKQERNGGPNKGGIPLNKMINNMILGDTQHTSIQIIDIPTQSTICHFAPLYGVSHLSMSPHDTTLATVSLNGDQVYTYDLTFLPFEVSVTGRYVRGKLPAKVRQVVWDGYGGLGIITWEKGSLHWFDKRRSFDSANKVWKMSGWGIEQGCFIAEGLKNDDDGTRTQLFLLNHGQVLLADVNTGKCTWKYDLPLGPIPEAAMAISSPVISSASSSSEESSDAHSDLADEPVFSLDLEQRMQHTLKSTESKRSRKKKQASLIDKPIRSEHRKKDGAANVDPLSYYEMEACLPFPYVHEDRRISMRIFDESKKGAHAHYESVGIDVAADYAKLDLFGCDITTTPIDFGKPDGQAKFRGSPAKLQELSRRDDEDMDEIKHAMESMVIDSTSRHRRMSEQSLGESPPAVPQLSYAATLASESSSSSSDHEVIVNGHDEKQEPDVADLVDLIDYPHAP